MVLEERDPGSRETVFTGARKRPVVPVWRRLLFSVLVAIAFVGALEAVARLLIAPEDIPLLESPIRGSRNAEAGDVFLFDPELFWVLRPGLRLPPGSPWGDRTNGLGLRNSDEPARVKSKPRVLCVGDSCTYGLGVPLDQAWPSGLDDEVESLNAGVPGYSSFQGLAAARRWVGSLHPDCIVIQFGANDANPWPTFDRGRIVTLTDRERAGHIRIRSVITRSRLVAWLLASTAAAKPTEIPALDDHDFSGLPVRVPLDEFKSNVESACRLVPASVVVAWPKRRMLDAAYADPVPRERAAAYFQAIKGVGSADRVVDVADVFRKSGHGPRELFLDDVHATPLGCELIRVAVRQAVREALAAHVARPR